MDFFPGEPVSTSTCHGFGGNQAWSLTASGEIESDELCLTVSGPASTVKMNTCHRKKESQEWIYNTATKQVQHAITQTCLSAYVDPSAADRVNLHPCDQSDPHQIWEFGGFKR